MYAYVCVCIKWYKISHRYLVQFLDYLLHAFMFSLLNLFHPFGNTVPCFHSPLHRALFSFLCGKHHSLVKILFHEDHILSYLHKLHMNSLSHHGWVVPPFNFKELKTSFILYSWHWTKLFIHLRFIDYLHSEQNAPSINVKTLLHLIVEEYFLSGNFLDKYQIDLMQTFWVNGFLLTVCSSLLPRTWRGSTGIN